MNLSAIKKLIRGLELTIKAWEELKLDKQAPAEYEKLQQQLQTLKEQYGN